MPLRHPCYETCFWNASHLYRFYCHIMICWILKRCKRLRQMALWCQVLGLCRYLRGLMGAHITRGNMCCSTVAKDTRDCMEFLDCLNLSSTKFRSMKRTASRSRVAALVKQRLKLTSRKPKCCGFPGIAWTSWSTSLSSAPALTQPGCIGAEVKGVLEGQGHSCLRQNLNDINGSVTRHVRTYILIYDYICVGIYEVCILSIWWIDIHCIYI